MIIAIIQKRKCKPQSVINYIASDTFQIVGCCFLFQKSGGVHPATQQTILKAKLSNPLSASLRTPHFNKWHLSFTWLFSPRFSLTFASQNYLLLFSFFLPPPSIPSSNPTRSFPQFTQNRPLLTPLSLVLSMGMPPVSLFQFLCPPHHIFCSLQCIQKKSFKK